MEAADAGLPQLPDHFDCELNAKVFDSGIITLDKGASGRACSFSASEREERAYLDRVESFEHIVRDESAAHVRHPAESAECLDWHDARKDRNGQTTVSGLGLPFFVGIGVVEQLSDDKIGSGLLLV